VPENRNECTVIVKRKKVVAGDGHHGGAWKVAMVSSSFF
jgi:chemotaxis protein MotB